MLRSSCVKFVHLLKSDLGKTGLLGGSGLFWERSGLGTLRELSFVDAMFLEDPVVLGRFWISLTLHSRRKTGDFWS